MGSQGVVAAFAWRGEVPTGNHEYVGLERAVTHCGVEWLQAQDLAVGDVVAHDVAVGALGDVVAPLVTLVAWATRVERV